jgi:hypothetical protein
MTSTSYAATAIAEIIRLVPRKVKIMARSHHRENDTPGVQSEEGSEVSTEVATPRGFEPLISTVTGWHVRPLHHGADYPLTGPPACHTTSRESISLQLAIQDRVAFVDESLPLP